MPFVTATHLSTLRYGQVYADPVSLFPITVSALIHERSSLVH